jgi:hypothetical protein
MRTLSAALCALVLCTSPALAAPPENELGQILFKARELDGLKRVSEVHFEGSDARTYLSSFELKTSKGKIDMLFTEYHRKSPADQMGVVINFGGSLSSVSAAEGETILNGVVSKGSLVFDDDAKTVVPLPKESLVPFPLAIVLLPSYYDVLPKEFRFSTLVGARVMPGFRLLVKDAREGLQLVELQGPGGIKIGVYVSTKDKQIRHLEMGGELVKRITPAAAKKLLAAQTSGGAAMGAKTPQVAVENLIAALAAGDLDAVSSCFSPNAPGEFQSLVKKTCPPENFKKLCAMFKGAKITGTKVEGDKAVVSVKLTKRDERLTVVNEGGVWRVLDF